MLPTSGIQHTLTFVGAVSCQRAVKADCDKQSFMAITPCMPRSILGVLQKLDAYVILSPALIEHYIQHHTWEAPVVLNHAYHLTLKLLLLCR